MAGIFLSRLSTSTFARVLDPRHSLASYGYPDQRRTADFPQDPLPIGARLETFRRAPEQSIYILTSDAQLSVYLNSDFSLKIRYDLHIPPSPFLETVSITPEASWDRTNRSIQEGLHRTGSAVITLRPVEATSFDPSDDIVVIRHWFHVDNTFVLRQRDPATRMILDNLNSYTQKDLHSLAPRVPRTPESAEIRLEDGVRSYRFSLRCPNSEGGRHEPESAGSVLVITRDGPPMPQSDLSARFNTGLSRDPVSRAIVANRR